MTYRSIGERVGGELYRLEKSNDKVSSSIRVSMPAIIKEIDYDRMVISAQPCIKEKVKQDNGALQDVSFPIIEDIPLVFPSSSKFCITFPIQIDDECLLIFSDSCIDSWWQSGGIQTQFEYRRHDLSDCFAIPSQMSQVKRIENFNTNSLEIRNRLSGMKIEVLGNTVKVGGVDILSFKESFDTLLNNYNDLVEAFNTLKLNYEQHMHNLSVSGITSGSESANGQTGIPI